MSGDYAAAHNDDETRYDDNDNDRSDDIDIVHHHDDCGDDCAGKLLEHVLDQLAANELHVNVDNHDIIVHVNDDAIHYVNDDPAGSGRLPERG